MAITSTEITEDAYDSFSNGNALDQFALVGATTGANGVGTVKAAVTGKQIYFKGHVYVSAATIITLKSAAAGTVICTLGFAVPGTQEIPVSRTKAAELLQIHSSADVTLYGTVTTLAVAQGWQVPRNWML